MIKEKECRQRLKIEDHVDTDLINLNDALESIKVLGNGSRIMLMKYNLVLMFWINKQKNFKFKFKKLM